MKESSKKIVAYDNRFNNLKGEIHRSRKEKSFMVPVKEIIDNNYYLGINKYRVIDIEKPQYDEPSVIYNDIKKLEEEFEKSFNELGGLI